MDKKAGPRVGVGVFVIKNKKFLIGLRTSDHGRDTWGLPGGKLDLKETVEQCARRELFEETGLSVGKLQFAGVTDDFFPNGLHYITIFLTGTWKSGRAQVKEPEKCRAWRWVDWHSLPSPLFLPLKNLLKTAKKPF